ncbi:MAG: class I SAM-dependent methyltransferase [Rhodospirillaceae bacterium]
MTADPVAPLPDPIPDAETLPGLPRIRNGTMLTETIAFDGKAVLDVGSGDGRLARLMAKAGARVVLGLEVEDRQLAHALAGPPTPGVAFLKCGGEVLPLPDQSADVIVYFNSLHHLPGVPAMQAAMAEAARVLTPGGLLYMAEPIAAGGFFALTKLVDDETVVRAQAYGVLLNLASGSLPLSLVQETLYTNTLKEPSFALLKTRMTSISPARDAAFSAAEPELAALFVSQGIAVAEEPEARLFEQPMRMMLFRKD